MRVDDFCRALVRGRPYEAAGVFMDCMSDAADRHACIAMGLALGEAQPGRTYVPPWVRMHEDAGTTPWESVQQAGAACLDAIRLQYQELKRRGGIGGDWLEAVDEIVRHGGPELWWESGEVSILHDRDAPGEQVAETARQRYYRDREKQERADREFVRELRRSADAPRLILDPCR